MEEYIKNVIFKDREDFYNRLYELSENIRKLEMKRKPIRIEFMGSARSEKTTSIKLIQDVFIKNGLSVFVVDEEYVKITKEINDNRNKKMNVDGLDYTHQVIEEKISIYDETAWKNYDVILYDRGINDEFVWLDTFGSSKQDMDQYDEKIAR